MRVLFGCILVVIPTLTQGQSSDPVDRYLKSADYEFKLLIGKTSSELSEKWRAKHSAYVREFIKKSEMLQGVKRILSAKGELNESVFAFSYLKVKSHSQLKLIGPRSLVRLSFEHSVRCRDSDLCSVLA